METQGESETANQTLYPATKCKTEIGGAGAVVYHAKSLPMESATQTGTA